MNERSYVDSVKFAVFLFVITTILPYLFGSFFIVVVSQIFPDSPMVCSIFIKWVIGIIIVFGFCLRLS